MPDVSRSPRCFLNKTDDCIIAEHSADLYVPLPKPSATSVYERALNDILAADEGSDILQFIRTMHQASACDGLSCGLCLLHYRNLFKRNKASFLFRYKIAAKYDENEAPEDERHV